MSRRTRAERRESRKATKRLHRFRLKEVPRLRRDCAEFRLSEAVAVASMRREACAIIGDKDGGRLHMERGQLVGITLSEWAYSIDGATVKARKV